MPMASLRAATTTPSTGLGRLRTGTPRSRKCCGCSCRPVRRLCLFRISTVLSYRLHEAIVHARQGNLPTVLANRVRRARGRPRRLLPHAWPDPCRESSRRLNQILQELEGETRYLEIGVLRGGTLQTIRADLRVGVDPGPRFDTEHLPRRLKIFRGTSDEFFTKLSSEELFDVIFVDGNHTYEQAYRDVINGFRHSTRCGVVLSDDVVPADANSALRDYEESRQRQRLAGVDRGWQGDVFIMLAILRDHHPDLAFRVIVGSGHEQAVIWNTRPERAPELIPAHMLKSYRNIQYADVFTNGVPDWFNTGKESSVMGEVVAHCHGRLRGEP